MFTDKIHKHHSFSSWRQSLFIVFSIYTLFTTYITYSEVQRMQFQTLDEINGAAQVKGVPYICDKGRGFQNSPVYTYCSFKETLQQAAFYWSFYMVAFLLPPLGFITIPIMIGLYHLLQNTSAHSEENSEKNHT